MGCHETTGRRALSAATLALALTLAPAALAQAPGGSKVAAEALFEEGRSLVTAGKYAEACPKFADSQRLDPSAGTLLNLASCYEKLGRTATAWATYREAASVASAAGRADYVATAQRHAEALAPKLARLTTSVAREVDGLRLRRDGTELARSEWGVPIPVDPGTHKLEASAPGYKPWTASVDVTQESSQIAATVPPLEPAPEAPAATPAPSATPAPASPPVPPPAAPREGGGGGTQRALGLALGGVGVAGLATSGVFAILAKNKYSDSLKSCQPSNANLCSSPGVSERNDARGLGDAASVAFGIGAAALVGGAIVWLTAPAGVSQAAAGRIVVAPTLGGAVLQGAF